VSFVFLSNNSGTVTESAETDLSAIAAKRLNNNNRTITDKNINLYPSYSVKNLALSDQ